jgi:hypothetical protein
MLYAKTALWSSISQIVLQGGFFVIRQPHISERFFGMVFIFVTVTFSFWLRDKYPTAHNILPYIVVIIGAPLFLGAVMVAGRYRKVFDYEPAQFLGLETNGLKIRTFFGRVIFTGGWLMVLGIILFIIG